MGVQLRDFPWSDRAEQSGDAGDGAGNQAGTQAGLVDGDDAGKRDGEDASKAATEQVVAGPWSPAQLFAGTPVESRGGKEPTMREIGTRG